MSQEHVLPILYDLSVTIGGEMSLKPLLARTLQRLLYHTSFPAGFISLDLPADDHSGADVEVRIDAAVGDYDLVGLIGTEVTLPKALIYGAAVRESEQAVLLESLPCTQTRYQAYFRLPINGSGVIVLLAPEPPQSLLPLIPMFQPTMAHLAKSIVLCRSNDAYTSGLVAERNLLAEVFDNSNSGVMLTDAEGLIVEVNPSFTRITGYTLDEVRGKNPHILSSGRTDHSVYTQMWCDIKEHGYWQGEVWNRRKDGEAYPEWLSINSVHNKAGSLTNYVAIFSDISKSKEAEAQIHKLAFYDPLTGLPNRRLLLEHLQKAMTAGVRSAQHGAVLLLDLDNFKGLNDSKGHAIGDLLLQEVATRLQACVRDGDCVARLGGDEFVVVLELLSRYADDAARQAELLAEKIRASLSEPYLLEGNPYRTTPSIGITMFIGHQESYDVLLKHADAAMYQAKTSGRNAFRFYDSEMQARLEANLQLGEELRQAIVNRQFSLVFQIQVDRAGRPLGVEVLLRWEHPKRGQVSPVEFIPMSEELGLIVPIGHWVLQTACQHLKTWQDDASTRDLTLAVNVSAKQFHQLNFVANVKRVLAESGIRPELLKLELTESTVLENVEEAILKMSELKLLGVSFSMDDFGTGYSSLQYLKRLPLDQVKIDQSFVRDIVSDANDAAIVKAIIAMSTALGMNVIAEGVESEAQREFLAAHGCHSFQGYLFSKPVPLDEFEKLVCALS